MFDDIVSWDNLWRAYESTQKSSLKYKKDAILFSHNPETNLKQLRDELISKAYQPELYSVFKVNEPKERIIYAPRYRDKVVHHLVNNVLRDFYEPRFIKHSYACIRNKGHLAAVKAIQHQLLKAKYEHGDSAYVVKADISKFFYSINHDALKDILSRHIKCERTIWLLGVIIDNSPNQVGLPLGNLTSQLFANIYLNTVDQFMKRTVGIKYYARYADDFFFICEDKSSAKVALMKLRKYCNEKLSLVIPLRKTRVSPIKMGFHGLGVKINPNFVLLDARTKRRFRASSRRLIKAPTVDNTKSLSSSYAHIKNFSSRNFVINTIKGTGLILVPKRNMIKYRGHNHGLL